MAKSLIVLAFDSAGEAEKVHEALVAGKKEGILQIEDAAVVVASKKPSRRYSSVSRSVNASTVAIDSASSRVQIRQT